MFPQSHQCLKIRGQEKNGNAGSARTPLSLQCSEFPLFTGQFPFHVKHHLE